MTLPGAQHAGDMGAGEDMGMGAARFGWHWRWRAAVVGGCGAPER